MLESSNLSTSKLLDAKSKLISVSEQLSKINVEIFELLEADDIERDVLEKVSMPFTEGATPVTASVLR